MQKPVFSSFRFRSFVLPGLFLLSTLAMAWRCHGHNQQSLVQALKDGGIIKSRAVEAAMLAVDRVFFVNPEDKAYAYQDAPQPIGHGATISAPHMHAHCLELLSAHLQPGSQVLDVGSGSGYLAAAMAKMVCRPDDTQGKVVGVEHIPELVTNSIASVRSIDWARQLMEQGRLLLLQTDGRLGYPDASPYDAIHVGAASPQLPQALASQLAPGGRMVIPIGPQGFSQELKVVDKSPDGQHLTEHTAMGVVYVPLTDRPVAHAR